MATPKKTKSQSQQAIACKKCKSKYTEPKCSATFRSLICSIVWVWFWMIAMWRHRLCVFMLLSHRLNRFTNGAGDPVCSWGCPAGRANWECGWRANWAYASGKWACCGRGLCWHATSWAYCAPAFPCTNPDGRGICKKKRANGLEKTNVQRKSSIYRILRWLPFLVSVFIWGVPGRVCPRAFM